MFETSMMLIPGPRRCLLFCKSHWNMGEAHESCGEESLNPRAWNTGHGPTLSGVGGAEGP